MAGPFAGGYLIERGGWRWVCVVLGGVCVSGLGPVVVFAGREGEGRIKGDVEFLRGKIRGGKSRKDKGKEGDGREV